MIKNEVAHNISKVLRASLVACFMALFKWSDCLPYRLRNDVFGLILRSRVTHHRNENWGVTTMFLIGPLGFYDVHRGK